MNFISTPADVSIFPSSAASLHLVMVTWPDCDKESRALIVSQGK